MSFGPFFVGIFVPAVALGYLAITSIPRHMIRPAVAALSAVGLTISCLKGRVRPLARRQEDASLHNHVNVARPLVRRIFRI